jgi:hypothetical protein
VAIPEKELGAIQAFKTAGMTMHEHDHANAPA